MGDKTRQQVRRIFMEVAELPESERSAAVLKACGEDAALRSEVEAMLRAEAQAGGFMAAPTVDAMHQVTATMPADSDARTEIAATADTSIREAPGSQIGRYKLLQIIGEGGFGSVFMAEQASPVRRRVALKIIKLGMDTRQVVARFEQERQALAMMDHANIAKVFDAGATEAGRPYFVMELVKGDPIVVYCDKNNLSIQDRLELFEQVCNAVQHAHTKGIIHRDIKPSNIMVATQDGRPNIKVIDFGIAKATSARLTEKTLFTEHRQLIGTPEYMSPEQAEGDLDIDTRTDVYSLGVLLYELLTGTTPFESRSLRSAAYAEIQRIIREVEPPRPSTRLSNNSETIASVASKRHTDPKRLGTIVRGELDWIVMKALEKDRHRRYETANGLAMDIRRYLAGEAVVAAPPGAAYRVRKFIRRNRVMVTAGSAVAIALLFGVTGFAWQAHQAGVERDAAVAAKQAESEQRRIAEEQRASADAQRNRAVAAEAQVRARADELQRVSDFQSQMLRQVDPTEAGLRLSEDVKTRFDAALGKSGIPEDERAAQTESFASLWSQVNATDAARELIDRTILKPAVAAIDEQFGDQPVLSARLREVLAERYHDLGLDTIALSLMERVLKERKGVLGEEDPDTLTSIARVGAFLLALGRLDDAEPYYFEALEKSRRVLGEDDPKTLTYFANMGHLLCEQGKFKEAEPYVRGALDRRIRILGEDDPDTLTSMNNWASLLQSQGRLNESESYYRRTLERRRRVLGEDHPLTLSSINGLAGILLDQNKKEEAVSLIREVTEKRRRILGEVHPDTLISIRNLGSILDRMGQKKEAEALLREALANQRRLLGADHHSTISTLSNLAVSLANSGRFSEAEPMCREALERRRRVLGEDHRETLMSNNVMGYVLRRQDKNAEAVPFVRQTLAISRRVLGPTHPDTFLYAHNLALLLFDQDQFEEAETLLREVVEAGGSAIGAGHPTVLSAARNLGNRYLMRKRFAESAEILSKAEPDARKTYTGRDEGNFATLIRNLGVARYRLGQFAEAEANLTEAHDIFRRLGGPTGSGTLDCVQTLVNFYTDWNEAEPGKGHDAKATEWKANIGAATTATQPTTTMKAQPAAEP